MGRDLLTIVVDHRARHGRRAPAGNCGPGTDLGTTRRSGEMTVAPTDLAVIAAPASAGVGCAPMSAAIRPSSSAPSCSA